MSRYQMKRRQMTRMSMGRRIVISSFCFVLVASGLFLSVNISNINETKASAEGDFRTIASGNWEDAAIWELYNGRKWSRLGREEKAPDMVNNNIIIQKGTAVVMNAERTVSNVHVEKGASLKINSSAFHLQKINSGSQMIVDGSLDLGTVVMDGNGSFKLNDDAFIVVGAPGGISKSGITGNVQVSGNRSFSKYATYTFRSPDKQFAGKGLPSEVSVLIVDNPFELELENNLLVSTSLILKRGILSTENNSLTLGTGITSAGILTREEGSVKGTFKRWLGPGAMKDVLFPMSDGKNYNAIFMNANKDDYRGGTFTFTFNTDNGKKKMDDGKRMMDDGNTSSTNHQPSSKVLVAGENGSYKVSASDGFEDGAYKMLSTAAIGKNENKSYWQLKAKTEIQNAKTEMRTAELAIDNVSEIVVWPNPFKDNFTLKFNLAQPAEIIAELFNSNGQRIRHELINGEDRTNEIQFSDVSSLAPGIYILNITEAGKLITSKRVVKG